MTPSTEMKTHAALSIGFCLIIAGGCIACGLICLGSSLGSAMKYSADQELESARLNAQAAREHFKAQEQRSIAAYMELEAVRTNVEKAKQKQFMAEARLSKACLKLKGKC